MVQKNTVKNHQLSASFAGIYSNPATRISLELLLSFVLVLVLAVVAIQPTLTTIAELNKEIEEKKELTSKLSSKISAVTTAIDVYGQYEDKIELLDQALPSSANLIPTFKIIEKLAGENNVIITAASANKVPDETEKDSLAANAPLESLPISVTVMGQYQDMKSFVEALHDSRRTIHVLSASFSLEETRGQRALIANFSLDAPYYGQPSNP